MVELLILGVVAVMVGGIDMRPRSYSAPAGHFMNKDQWVETDPRALADAAGATLDTYALAAMMRSEAGDSEALRVAVGWCALNHADARREAVSRLLLRAGRNDSAGKFVPHESHNHFGRQNVGPRYAATGLAPRIEDLELAERVVSGDISDPTDGCTKFDAPGTQERLLAAGVLGYEKTAQEVAEERSRGADVVWLPGISSTRFWRPRV